MGMGWAWGGFTSGDSWCDGTRGLGNFVNLVNLVTFPGEDYFVNVMRKVV
jgi:hypothetical protein